MDATRRRSALPRWLWIAVACMGLGLFDGTQTVFVMRAQGMHHYWVRLFVTLWFSWLPWGLAAPLVWRLSHRYPLAEWRRVSTWAAHIAACIGIALVYAAWTSAWEELLNPWAMAGGAGPFVDVWLRRCYGGMVSYVILYGVILLAGHIVASRDQLARQQAETARLNEQLSKAQLDALRRQIEPHFLFNTLNAVAGLVRERRNDAAVKMIAGLSDFLRRVVEDSARHEVPLAEELEFTQKYLDIQKARFAERLEFTVDVPAELLRAQVPSLILQPMVENAVKHGIAQRVQGGSICISAARENGTLMLRVANDGPSLPAGWERNGTGIGIANVRTRLHSLYGDAFELQMRDRQSGGVEALVTLPLVAAGEGGEGGEQTRGR